MTKTGRLKKTAKQRRATNAVVVAALLLLVATAAYVSVLGISRSPVSLSNTVSFSLQASDGRVVGPDSFGDRLVVAYFGYTACRDVCPTALDSMQNALTRLGARADDVQPLFVTVDPAHDTPARLRGYLARFSPRILGLTGNAAQIATAEKSFGIDAAPAKAGQFDHSSVYTLMRHGRFVDAVAGDADAASLATALGRYLPK